MGLINESVDTDELLNYANEYIDGHNCNQIYNDLLTYQDAVNSGEVKLSDNDKKTLKDSIGKIKTYKGFACGTIKSTMKSEFSKQANSDPNKLLESMCWFSKNVYVKNLNSCQPVVNQQNKNNTNQTVTTSKQSPSLPPTTNNPVIKNGWYYIDSNKQSQGPKTIEELKGLIDRNTLVYNNKFGGKWISAGDQSLSSQFSNILGPPKIPTITEPSKADTLLSKQQSFEKTEYGVSTPTSGN